VGNGTGGVGTGTGGTGAPGGAGNPPGPIVIPADVGPGMVDAPGFVPDESAGAAAAGAAVPFEVPDGAGAMGPAGGGVTGGA